MAGLALGDALGAHVEFRPQSYLAEHPVTGLEGGGTWGLLKGQVKSLDSFVYRLFIRYSLVRKCEQNILFVEL